MTPRRAFFNPTSLPELRVQRARLYNTVGRSAPRQASSRGIPEALKGQWAGQLRRASGQAGENKTGHINAGPSEGILFFDNIFPLKLQWALRLPLRLDRTIPELLSRFDNAKFGLMEPIALVKRAIPSSANLKVTEILPRLKDGGAFVKFSYPAEMSPKELEDALRKHLKEHPIKPWFNPFRRIRTNLVQGKPWLEDLARYPSTLLKIEFVPTAPGAEVAELSQETLYSLFRRYGKIGEITSQPSDSKVAPRYAFIDFANVHYSVMAKNCMHGFRVSESAGGGKTGTQLRLSYEQKIKAHMIREWIFSHPRIVIPAVAAVVATVTVAIFDPIRTFFIKAHIEHSFRLKDTAIYRWFKSQAVDIFSFRHHNQEEASFNALWDDRKTLIEQLQTWLLEASDTFIVVQGPRGSGKKELILNQALKSRKNVLVIDCKPIQEARGDSATIRAAAAQVGYRPVFSWMNSISSLVDLAAQGTIGVKSGFSETLDSQLGKILQNTALALRQVGLQDRPKHDKDANLADDEYLEAHPDRLPVVVIDNFLHKSEEGGPVYDKIAEWAAGLTTANLAHVIFLTNDSSYSKSLEKALPNQVFRRVALGDLTRDVAKKFVVSHLEIEQPAEAKNDEGSADENKLTLLKERQDLKELDDCIDVLGGRLTDLEFLSRRLQAGQTPKKAVEEIIEQASSEILKMYLLDIGSGSSDHKWSAEQAWWLISTLSKKEKIPYSEILLENTFSSSLTNPNAKPEPVLEALAQAELITIQTANGRPQAITAGRPVYQAAFRQLMDDEVLKARFDLAILTELSKIEAKSIDKYETELSLLASLPKQPSELAARVQYLLKKVQGSQAKVENWESEMAVLKKVLAEKF